MNKDEAIKEAIKRIKGQPAFVGQIVACESHSKACELLRYENDLAICFDGTEEKTFPRSEIFDPKKVINVANHLLNIGFWKEGMGSMIVNIEKK